MPPVALRLQKFRDLFSGKLDEAVFNDIRVTTQRGLILGTDEFRAQVAELLGREGAHCPRGRPTKKRPLFYLELRL
ncbi:hypothetical protein DFR28_102452 [Arenicella xantha]|uniref:Transposase n=1 Tax=Arenicella xantha TaxID=644221 RepID=A0A395JJS2_9GAMM|nr:hypothetical protein DFR28_102452 [Arenicella xantha]